MDFQGKVAYGYKTNPFGFIEFLLELKRKEGVRVGERFYETDGKEKIIRAQRVCGKEDRYTVLKGNLLILS